MEGARPLRDSRDSRCRSQPDPAEATAFGPLLNVYLDASALLKLLLREPASDEVEQFLADATGISSSFLLYVEGRAALAAALRAKRIRPRVFALVRARLDDLVDRIDLIALEGTVTALAGEVAERHRLRAGDAVHLGSALVLGDPQLVVASWDDELRRAALDVGLAVFPGRLRHEPA